MQITVSLYNYFGNDSRGSWQILKKCAVINDLSGFGKCSLTAAIPVLSVMGCEAHPLPTAILSNQTGYKSYRVLSMTDYMQAFMNEWKKLGVSFDGILTGYVCDEKQIDLINNFIDAFKCEDTILAVDPVMADGGKLYDGFTDKITDKIRTLCSRADIITPNVSELSILADEPFCKNINDIEKCVEKVKKLGIKNIIVTGFDENDRITNLVYSENDFTRISSKKYGGSFSGTGDLFVSIVLGAVMNGKSIISSVKLASSFLEKAIKYSDISDRNDGIDFERYLGDLAYEN